MKDPIESAELRAFVQTVDDRSLSRAAAALAVPRATISRRLARLEERLGVRLLRRTTRSLVLTDAGDAFLRHARIALEAVARAEESVSNASEAVRGSLRVSAPPISSASFHALICEFARAHPDVRLEVHTTSRVVDLKRDGYDVAIRAGVDLAPGLVARVLSRDPIIAAASPRYLAEHGTPRVARDLRAHRLLLGFARGELPQSHWPRVGGGQLHVEGVFASNDMGLLTEAAVRGMGIALLPSVIARGSLERGELAHVLPTIVGATTRIAVVYAEREFVPPQVKAFVDAVAEWAPRDLADAAAQRVSRAESEACDEQEKRIKASRDRGSRRRAPTAARERKR